tara:strand:+ start:4249 stop:5754 length:1506 start_codon:yes stop_codon:yes gene_type:complete
VNLFFRLNASDLIGYGHLSRCINLADGLKREDKKIKNFFLFDRPNSLKINKKIKILYTQSNYEGNSEKIDIKKDYLKTISFIKKYNPKLLILDHYDITFTWEKKISKYVKLMIIDDLNNRKHTAKYILDYSLNRNIKSYSDLVQKNTIKFMGPNYFLFKYSMKNKRKKSFKNQSSDKIKTIMINFGGFDKKGYLLKTLKLILFKDLFLGKKFILLTGFNNKLHLKIKELIIQSKRKKDFKIYADTKNITDLYSNSDLAIGSGGVSSYERLMFGIPTIQINTYRNQINNTNCLNESNLIVKLKKLTEKNLINSYDKLIKNKYKIFKLSYSIFNDDVYNILYNKIFCKNKLSSKSIKIFPMSIFDKKFLYTLQNKKNIRSFFFSKEKVSKLEHNKWFIKNFFDNTTLLFKIILSEENVGFIRLSLIKNNDYDISIIVDPIYQNRGIATKTLQLIKKIMVDKNLIAKIYDKNIASIKIFKKNGFKFKSIQNNIKTLILKKNETN